MCDFSGYVEPEMVKFRRVVVVSPRGVPSGVALVVPISKTAPHVPGPVHVRLPGGHVYRCFTPLREVWAKGDMIAHVRYDRLDRVRIPICDVRGVPIPRRWEWLDTISLTEEDLRRVRAAVLSSIGLGRLAHLV